MDTTGEICAIGMDYKTRKATVTLTLDCDPADLEQLQDMGLDVKLKKHREHRSLDANGMLWGCLKDIAEATQTDKWQVYLDMLKHYGQFTYVLVKPTAVDRMKQIWRETEVVGEIDVHGNKSVQLLCYYGSSMYDTKEFSILLDGVLREMENLGLPKPPSKEMQRLLEEWKK